MKTPVCAIFDIGKTNKKLLLFSLGYEVVWEKQQHFIEVKDDDSFHGEDIAALTNWLKDSLDEVLQDSRFEVIALNFAAYGASMVHLDAIGRPVAPLYNYLKPFPEALRVQFFDAHGPADDFAAITASPHLGMLNSGLQLYWLKYQKPKVFAKTVHSLHLPQYCSYVFTNKPFSEITSVGCHTGLWDFRQWRYHSWIAQEQIASLGQMILPSFVTVKRPFSAWQTSQAEVGIGIHDSSAALVPYLTAFGQEPFLLVSTGTWCIAMNPFSQDPLTLNELHKDCLNYLTFRGNTVKASRLFAGNEHERQTKHIAEYFGMRPDFFAGMKYRPEVIASLRSRFRQAKPEGVEINALQDSTFAERNMNDFLSFEEAYHQLMLDLVGQQVASIKLAMGKTRLKKIFIDGGFSKNPLYMNLLAESLPDFEIFASEIAQATALGAALVITDGWNKQAFGKEHFKLKKF